MNKIKDAATNTADREMVITRILDAPRELVWKHVMHGPDGTDYPNKSTFTAIVKPERIEYSHGGGRRGDPAVQFDATWTFETVGDQTKVTFCALFSTVKAYQTTVRLYDAIEGGKQTLARLADYLAKI